MATLEYRDGYVKALMDVAGWINRPNQPLDKKLCQPKHIDAILVFMIQNIDSFMKCPDLFELSYEIDKRKRLRLWHEDCSV